MYIYRQLLQLTQWILLHSCSSGWCGWSYRSYDNGCEMSPGLTVVDVLRESNLCGLNQNLRVFLRGKTFVQHVTRNEKSNGWNWRCVCLNSAAISLGHATTSAAATATATAATAYAVAPASCTRSPTTCPRTSTFSTGFRGHIIRVPCPVFEVHAPPTPMPRTSCCCCYPFRSSLNIHSSCVDMGGTTLKRQWMSMTMSFARANDLTKC